MNELIAAIALWLATCALLAVVELAHRVGVWERKGPPRELPAAKKKRAIGFRPP